jgi:hypothetical protein
MMIPSMVKAERILLTLRALKAMRKLAKKVVTYSVSLNRQELQLNPSDFLSSLHPQNARSGWNFNTIVSIKKETYWIRSLETLEWHSKSSSTLSKSSYCLKGSTPPSEETTTGGAGWVLT